MYRAQRRRRGAAVVSSMVVAVRWLVMAAVCTEAVGKEEGIVRFQQSFSSNLPPSAAAALRPVFRIGLCLEFGAFYHKQAPATPSLLARWRSHAAVGVAGEEGEDARKTKRDD